MQFREPFFAFSVMAGHGRSIFIRHPHRATICMVFCITVRSLKRAKQLANCHLSGICLLLRESRLLLPRRMPPTPFEAGNMHAHSGRPEKCCGVTNNFIVRTLTRSKDIDMSTSFHTATAAFPALSHPCNVAPPATLANKTLPRLATKISDASL